jgi:hypothetical protein
MTRVSAILVILLSLLLLAQATPALAWSNGTGGYNSYGTHDWVLDKALDALGHRADWVCVRAALRATDDPDSKDGLDHASGTWWHVYDVWGDEYGAAPEAVEVWFRRAQQRLDRGKECAASRALGIMAHLLADVAQPMHTDGSLTAENRVHGPYESAVDSRSEIGDNVYSFDFDGVDPAAPYRRAVRVAHQAHRLYSVLVRTYDAHGYNARVARITQRQLNRAANAVADLIAAMS